MKSPPSYYSGLGSFREMFISGGALLCFHKIETPPRRARIKGLYLSPAIFRRQIQELKEAGFQFVLPQLPERGPSLRQVSITFDDGFVSNWEKALPCMTEFGCRAINYLVADRIGQTSDWEAREGGEADPLMNESQIRDWLAAGHWIGAHTCTHPRLSLLSRKEAREEIFSGKKKLEDRFGTPVDHFAYPYGDYNETTVELVQEAGFQTACTMHRGINLSDTSPFELKRWTARYPSRTFRNFLRRFF